MNRFERLLGISRQDWSEANLRDRPRRKVEASLGAVAGSLIWSGLSAVC